MVKTYMFLVGAFFAKFKENISSVLSINIFVLLAALVSIYFISDYLVLADIIKAPVAKIRPVIMTKINT